MMHWIDRDISSSGSGSIWAHQLILNYTIPSWDSSCCI